MDGNEKRFPAKNALDCRILHVKFHILRRDTPKPRRSAPRAWTQTPISDSLDGVPIVAVLRNGHWCLTLTFRCNSQLQKRPATADVTDRECGGNRWGSGRAESCPRCREAGVLERHPCRRRTETRISPNVQPSNRCTTQTPNTHTHTHTHIAGFFSQSNRQISL